MSEPKNLVNTEIRRVKRRKMVKKEVSKARLFIFSKVGRLQSWLN